MTSGWVGANTTPSETAQALAEAVRQSHDPAAIAQAAMAKRAANEAAREASYAQQMENYDPRTSAEKIAGVPHDYAYDDPRAKRFLPSQPPGPRDKEQEADHLKKVVDEELERLVAELGLTPAQQAKFRELRKKMPSSVDALRAMEVKG